MAYETMDDAAPKIHYDLTAQAAKDMHDTWKHMRDQERALADEIMRRERATSGHEMGYLLHSNTATCKCGEWSYTDGCGLCQQIRFYDHAGWALTDALRQHTFSTRNPRYDY